VHLRRSIRSFAAFSLAGFLLFGLATRADAAGEKDKDALKLLSQAMDEDYLATDFAKASKKLNDAVKKCGKDGCTPEVLGKVYVALGTVQGVGEGKLDLAKESFTKAVQADPKAALDASLTTPELTKVFAEAQKAAGTGGTTPSGTGGTTATPPGDTPKAPAGDLVHTPPPEQTVNHPVPIFVEIPDDIEVAKVTVQYKPFGGTKFKPVEMKKMSGGFGALIPCEDVTTTGDIRYYIIATDPEGGSAGTAGNRNDPFKVAIKNEIEGDAPSLPGKKPPEKCRVKEDCPPGLPGCPDPKGPGEPRGDKGWGASCEENKECKEGLICLNGSCEEGKDDGSGSSKPSGPGKKNIFSLTAQLDWLLIPGAEKVCSGVDATYACFYQDGEDATGQFYGDPAEKGGTNGISGGLGVGGARVMIGYDRELWNGLGVGARFGIAFGGSPSSDTGPPSNTDYDTPAQAKGFLPIHWEIRANYYIFGSGLEKGKIRPYVFVGGGQGQVNASVAVSVCDRVAEDGTRPPEDPDSSCEVDGVEAQSRQLDAYKITGLGHVDAGGGATYAITENFGVALELKLMFMVPTFGFVLAPTLGPVFGF
jgi:hypothetical protein